MKRNFATDSFWVCEKSDGVRVLVLIVATGFGQEVYLVRSRRTKKTCRAANSEQPLLTRRTLRHAFLVRDVQVDRKNDVYQVYWLTFPHQDGEEFNHSNTVLDGEFVIDVDPVTGAVSFRRSAVHRSGLFLARECSRLDQLACKLTAYSSITRLRPPRPGFRERDAPSAGEAIRRASFSSL